MSDAAPNMISSTRSLQTWHLVCIAHDLNVLVKKSCDQIPALTSIRHKSRQIVTYFRSSTTAKERFQCSNRWDGQPWSLAMSYQHRNPSLRHTCCRMSSLVLAREDFTTMDRGGDSGLLAPLGPLACRPTSPHSLLSPSIRSSRLWNSYFGFVDSVVGCLTVSSYVCIFPPKLSHFLQYGCWLAIVASTRRSPASESLSTSPPADSSLSKWIVSICETFFLLFLDIFAVKNSCRSKSSIFVLPTSWLLNRKSHRNVDVNVEFLDHLLLIGFSFQEGLSCQSFFLIVTKKQIMFVDERF